ncbi:hypothetical protein DRO56_03120 [Candidatus Bathyarchaeota archaeon]|mgnify:CR=1 FL=1|nr:hypothetical protein [Candidatus Bathyarchaeota archaeon]RJS89711.1 MAG: hypothetical protein CW700_03225 [Candidatus Bathyarchaeota archaeon]RLI32691.1 MAG: hypothetical protein DRO56_03120 [Candidatus Bathyarchaeota archaeon]
MGKIKTLEIVVRGDIIEKNLILMLAEALRDSKLRADFSSNIVVPPFLKAVERRYPSLAVLYATVDIEDLFKFRALIEELCEREECCLISLTVLDG